MNIPLNSLRKVASIMPKYNLRLKNSYCNRLSAVALLVLSLSFILIVVANLHEQQNDDSTQANSDSIQADSGADKELRASEALDSIRNWALRFGRDIFYGTQEASCFRVLHDQFNPSKSDPSRRGPHRASVISNDWTSMHADTVRTISNTMGWHKSAVESIARASEGLAKNHTFDEALRFDYVDVHRLYDLNDLPGGGGPDSGTPMTDGSSPNSETSPDYTGPNEGPIVQPQNAHTETARMDLNGQLVEATEQSIEQLGTPAPLQGDRNYSIALQVSDVEWQTPVRYMRLQKNRNFGDVPISTEESAVHVPVHLFSGDPTIMNGIAWSDSLTKVFKDNYVRNPKLTNQYFASQSGFMRLFPAQPWQIARTDPDLYDARMRPWYVAGATSRKEVVILVDASGSMTGSRRDIAKGVVFEILDTLTDNDNFLILKFSDKVEQVGVPGCDRMRLKRRRGSNIPLQNQLYHPDDYEVPGSVAAAIATTSAAQQGTAAADARNGTDVESLYFLPATGRNVRYVKTNFTIPTSGIANFNHALVTAFEVLLKYQDSKQLGGQCNQAIMLITDGSPSDFEEIFNRYNYPNAPVRVFTYLIGRETGDGTHTKMMACHNRGYYTHVINLAEVRETVQQYVSVMARPLVLNRAHPITWTPAYGELTYQVLTDWIWESRRREQARAILASKGRGALSNGQQQSAQQQQQQQTGGGYVADISFTNSDEAQLLGGQQQRPGDGGTDSLLEQAPGDLDGGQSSIGDFTVGGDALEQELDALDLFGHHKNPDCFWETTQNDLLTTVVQPVHDLKNESKVVERFLNKNTWVTHEMTVRTANLLGVAAADMKINDIIALAPSHKLGPNGYAIMLTNNGLVMHHPDLRSILEPGFNQKAAEASAVSSGDPQAVPTTYRLNKLDRDSRILKPFFSSLDFSQVEHILQQSGDADLLQLRQEAVDGLTGWRELMTKRTIDCQRRVQSRKQSFYYKSLEQFPFSFIISIPQPYGSHRLEAQIDVKSAPSTLPEKLTTYFTTSDFDIWTVHPSYEYCTGPSNNTITSLLDMFQRIQEQKLDDVQAKPAESSKPPVHMPGKIIYDKELVQSLVYDAVATYGFSDSCSFPTSGGEQNFLSMFGVRFSFVSTRSGLTRVRHFIDDINVKREALAFAKRHSRGPDETFYKRTVDFNMLINETATLVQVPFNMHEKIFDRLNRYEIEQLDRLADDGINPMAVNTSDVAFEAVDGFLSTTPSSIGYNKRVSEMDLFEKLEILANSSLHSIATQSIIVNEGNQRAVAGVIGVFYDYAHFVLRLLNTTNSNFRQKTSSNSNGPLASDPSSKVRCGFANDTLDCLLVDNNGYIIASEQLEFIGRHLQAYDPVILSRLVTGGVFHEINVTDYQSICLDQGDKQAGDSSSNGGGSTGLPLLRGGLLAWLQNLAAIARHTLTIIVTLSGLLWDVVGAMLVEQVAGGRQGTAAGGQMQPSMLSLIPNKTYLRPCERILTRYETRPGMYSSDAPEYYRTQCDCPAWFIYEQVAQTNLILIIVDSAVPACRQKCDRVEQKQQQTRQQQDQLNTQFNIIGLNEKQVCSMIERESKLYKRTLDSCYAHHPDEEHIRLCGSAINSARLSNSLIIFLLLISTLVLNIRLRRLVAA